MPDNIILQPDPDDQQLLAQVIGYYHTTLKETPDALAYLHRRGIKNAQAVEHFRIGFADRSLGLKLPSRQGKSGVALRERLQELGLFRGSGHEHFRGSITVPICAADGTGRIVDIYGRKIRDDLRKGTPIHTHLNDKKEGVWNIEAFGTTDEIVLCGSLWDALTFWSHGYRNVTTMFGPYSLSSDLLGAFAEFSIKRVLTTCQAVTPRLMEAGMEVFLLKLPQGVDVNAYVANVDDPGNALGSLLRGAEWVGKGHATATVNGTMTPVPNVQPAALDDLLDAVDEDDLEDMLAEEEVEEEAEEQPPPIRTASPVPPAPQEIEAEVSDDEAAMTFGNRRYRVRGLGKNTSLDVLRVNILVSNGVGMFVDTFDLYSAKYRRAYQQQAAIELAVEEATVKKDLGHVLLKLEELQDAQMQAMLKPKQTQPDMNPEDRETALCLLRDPNLLQRISDDYTVVGERTNKIVGYLAAVSRKLDQPLAVMIQSTSAAGKSTLMEAILSFVPSEEVVKFSAMTGQSLYYMGEGNLKHRILAIVEEEGAQRASYALKLLQSEGELRIASTGKEASTGRLVTQEYKVEGPVMIFLTTTSITIDEELLNRCLVLTVDEDREQTRAIHQRQRQQQTLEGLLAAKAQEQTLALHRNAQRLLRPLPVVIPFAKHLTFADSKTRTRRDHQKYLTLIRSITLLHQHQRPIKTVEHDGKTVEYIEATLEDIGLANQLATVVLGRSLDELPPQTRKLLDLLDGMAGDVCQRQGIDRADYRFSRREVRDFTGWGNTQLKLHLGRLVDMEYLLVHREPHSKRFVYELAYDRPTHDGARVMTGLLDVERLRKAERSGTNEEKSGNGRPKVGPKSAHCRGQKSDAIGNHTNDNGVDDGEDGQNVDIPPVRAQPVMVVDHTQEVAS